MDFLPRIGLLLLAFTTPLLAAPSDYHLEINAQRKMHDDDAKKSTSADMFKNGDECAYNIVVANNSLKDTPPLTVKYVVFVQRERLGEKAGIEHPSRVAGSDPLPAIKTLEKGSIVTKSFSLTRSTLQAGWSYPNGGRAAARDSVKGVWVRVYDGDTMVGEYANPSSIPTKENWDK